MNHRDALDIKIPSTTVHGLNENQRCERKEQKKKNNKYITIFPYFLRPCPGKIFYTRQARTVRSSRRIHGGILTYATRLRGDTRAASAHRERWETTIGGNPKGPHWRWNILRYMYQDTCLKILDTSHETCLRVSLLSPRFFSFSCDAKVEARVLKCQIVFQLQY